MHRRKLRKYRILKDICAVVGGIAVLVMAGSADSYSQNLISTAEFFMAFGIALDMMIVAYITHDCVKEREKHYQKKKSFGLSAMKTEISGACMGQGKRLRSTHREKRKRKGPDISLSEIGQSEQKEEIGNTIPSRSPTAQGRVSHTS